MPPKSTMRATFKPVYTREAPFTIQNPHPTWFLASADKLGVTLDAMASHIVVNLPDFDVCYQYLEYLQTQRAVDKDVCLAMISSRDTWTKADMERTLRGLLTQGRPDPAVFVRISYEKGGFVNGDVHAEVIWEQVP